MGVVLMFDGQMPVIKVGRMVVRAYSQSARSHAPYNPPSRKSRPRDIVVAFTDPLIGDILFPSPASSNIFAYAYVVKRDLRTKPFETSRFGRPNLLKGKIKSVRFGPDAKYIVVGSMDRNIWLFGFPREKDIAMESGFLKKLKGIKGNHSSGGNRLGKVKVERESKLQAPGFSFEISFIIIGWITAGSPSQFAPPRQTQPPPPTLSITRVLRI
ncbi:unnamed protein product [Lactuca virosa]|uniref:Uncharacterized protein n=1 Tax=Lactuca virosa TaxID=75947 RepID=A0AAU9M4Y8_9ASTR|nr:unnamed protein product [Lactuca virosa]